MDLQLEQAVPPELFYHGSVERFLPSIWLVVLIRDNRHHVHLSKDVKTARKVGTRRGRNVILKVDAGKMDQDGHMFFVSANGVWLTDAVPPGDLSSCCWMPSRLTAHRSATTGDAAEQNGPSNRGFPPDCIRGPGWADPAAGPEWPDHPNHRD